MAAEPGDSAVEWTLSGMAVKAEIFKNAPYPNWTALGVNWLAGFDFEIKVVARIPSGAPAVTRHNPPTLWDMASGGYSQISVAEPCRLAFLSGQVGWLVSGGEAPNDIAGQAKIAGASLAAALTELGASGPGSCCCASTSWMLPRKSFSRSRLPWMN
jgi:enamine deaminase RidA (YjgF/YER057c/UK114 family)